MAGKYGVMIAVLAMALAAMTLGCGSASVGTSAAKPADSKVDSPFGEAGDLSDLKRGNSSSEEETFAADDLEIPGSQWGKKKHKAGSTAHCPKGRKGKKCRKKAKQGIPNSDAIKEQMEGIPWGMHQKAVLKQYETLIRDSYSDLLKDAGGAIEEDRVRTKMMTEIKKLRKSHVKFDGERTGYEGVMIETEFTHNHDESMLVWDAGKFVEYLFFFDNRFWKRLRTFRKDSFEEDITFENYIATLTNRFGEGKEYKNDEEELLEIKWKDSDTYMSALDRSGFYGVYCLVLTARESEDNLAKLRPGGSGKESAMDKELSSVVESVTSGDLVDHNTSVIDSYTGTGDGSSGSESVTSHHSVIEGNSEEPKEEKPAEDPKDELEVDDLF